MRLTVKQILDATPVIAQIINEKRPMSQKGKYRLARMHAKLAPEYNTADAQRVELVKAYNTPQVQKVGELEVPIPDAFKVPDDKLAEFNENWGKILAEEVEVEVDPIPLGLIDLGDAVNGSIEAFELVALGDLIA